MTHDILRDEIDILYAALNKLTIASTPAEQLEAVSDYARSTGASAGSLFYSDASGAQECVAGWALDGITSIPLGTVVTIETFPFARYALHSHEYPTFISDVATDPRVDEVSRKLLLEIGEYASAALPLFNKGRWVGKLIFSWSKPHYFDERDKRIFTALQQQAAPVVDSMRLYEQSEQRARWMETLATVNAALSRARDEQEILAAVARLVDGTGFSMSSLTYAVPQPENVPFEVENVALRSAGGYPLPLDIFPNRYFNVMEYPILRWLYEHPDEPVFVEDVNTDPRPGIHVGRTLAADMGWPAIVGLPLRTGGQWQGMIIFLWSTPQHFPHDLRALLRAVMPNAASVVTSRRNYLAEQEAREETELLYRASKGINGANTSAEIVQSLEQLNLTGLNVVLHVWERYDLRDATYLEVIAASHGAQVSPGLRYPTEQIPVAYSVEPNQLVVVEDTGDFSQIDPASAASAQASGYGAFIAVPLAIGQRFLGLLLFGSAKPRKFTPREKRLQAGIGSLVAAAVERIRLREETEAAQRRAERLAEQAQKVAALEERNRLARELHDSVSQALYGIGLGARTARTLLDRDPSRLAEPLDYILSLAEAGLIEMRALIFELRPESLEQEGLITALTKQAASLQARHGIRVEVEFCEEPPLPLEVKEGLYRIAREALHNTVKHAQAANVCLSLVRIPRGYRLSISDDGHGFDPNQSFPGHLGLQSMRERTQALNGLFRIESQPGYGTMITVEILTDP